MDPRWLLLLPPIITLGLAFATRRIVLSLMCGCLLAALILSDFSPLDSLLLFAHKFLSTTQLDQWTSWEGITKAQTPMVCLFVAISGILICTIEKTGGYQAFNKTLERYVTQKQQAELAAVTLSHCVSLDGYLSTLTVGSVMRPLIDKYHSTRVKLAFIARFLAVPICSVNPFSTWMALILLQLNVAGIHSQPGKQSVVLEDPFAIYFMVIPYMFYSILSLFTVWFVVGRQISFGAMGHLEHTPQPPIKHSGYSSSKQINADFVPKLFDFFSPIFALVFFTFLSFLYTGGWWVFGGSATLFGSMEHIDVSPSLLMGSVFSTAYYLIYMTFRGAISFKDWWPLAREGVMTMVPSILVLNLAWTFGALEVQADLVHTVIDNFIPKEVEFIWLPLIFFIGAILTSTAIGSSWATIGLLFPVVTVSITTMETHPIPFELAEIPLLLPTLGAVVSGAVAGDQLSPMSDSSFVVTASTQCVHADHIQSQFTYGMPIILFSCVAYGLAGWISIWNPMLAIVVPLTTSALLAAGYFVLRNKYSRYNLATKATLG